MEDKSTHMRKIECSAVAYCICLGDRKAFYLLFSSFGEEGFESVPSVFLNESPNDRAFISVPPFPTNVSLFIQDETLPTVRTDKLRYIGC